MTRAGETILHLSVYILVLGMLLEIGNETVALLRVERDADSASLALDRACDRLRRDLALGATGDEQTLIGGGVRWTVRDGRLERGGLAQVAVRSATWRQNGSAWIVTVQPRHGAARTLRVSAMERR